MDIARSPFAHAKIKSIDKSVAMEIPGVLAVIAGRPEAVQPSLDANPDVRHSDGPATDSDVSAQEVAAVIATDRYALMRYSLGKFD